MKITIVNLIGVLFAGFIGLSVGQTLGMELLGSSSLNLGSVTASTATYSISGTDYYLFGGDGQISRSSNPNNGGSLSTLVTFPAGTIVTSMDSAQLTSTSARLIACTSERNIHVILLTSSGYSWVRNHTYNAPGTYVPKCAYDVDHDRVWVAAGKNFVQVKSASEGTSEIKVGTAPSKPSGFVENMLTVVYDRYNEKVIYGTVGGWLVAWPWSATIGSSTPTYKKLGAWNQTLSFYNSVKKNTIFVSSEGFVSEVSAALTLTGIYLESDTSFSGAVLDIPNQVLFVSGISGSNSTIFRVQIDSWSSIAYLMAGDVGTIGSLGSGVIRDTNMFFPSSNGNLYAFKMFDCSTSDCNACALDTTYCGFCQSSRTCTASSACSSDDWNQSGYTCPVLDSISPSQGTADGGTTVTVLSSYLVNGQVISASDVSCEFVNVATVPARSVTYNSVTCVTPAITPRENRNVDVRIKYRSGLWAPNTVSFSYYACNAISDCSVCSSSTFPDCGWCYSTVSCSSQSSCTADWYRQCPTLSVSPDSSGFIAGKVVTVTVLPVVSSAISTYTVNFGAGTARPATRTSATTLTVTTPVLTQTVFDNLRGTDVELTTNVTVLSGSDTYASQSGAFMFYDCNAYSTDCASCTDSNVARPRKQDCKFCFDLPACVFVANNVACTATGSCPKITAVTPSAFHILKRDTTTLSVQGKFSFVSGVSAWRCAWNAPTTGAPSVFSANSTVVNSTYILCDVPASLTADNHQLSIWEGTNRITPDYTIEIYDCSDTQCSTCLNTAHPECFWCQASISCGTTAVTTCTNKISLPAQCPTLNMVAPSTAATLGGEYVFLDGNFILSAASVTTVECVFVQNTTFVVEAANYTDTGIACLTPAAYESGSNDTFVYVQVNGNQYTNQVPFEFYDCNNVQGNCLECLSVSRPLCKWCATGSCGYSCQSEVDICPQLLYVVPDHGYIGGGDEVVIYGGPFPTSGDTGDLIYTCIFASQAGIGIPSSDGASLTCTTPLGSNLIGNVSLNVNVGSQPYIPWASLNFLFFDCLTFSDRSCSDQCLQQQFCGWCATSSSCRPASRCSGSSDIFLDQCFNAQPSQNAAQLGVAQNLTVKVDPPLTSNQQLLSLLANTNASTTPSPITKRALWAVLQQESNSFYCSFEGVAAIPAEPSEDFTSLECPVPNVAVESELDFEVTFGVTPLTTPQTFTFVDCASIETCETCLAKSGCGWCIDGATQSCSVASLCSASFSQDTCAGAFNLAGLVAGVVVGAAVLAGAVVFIVLFLRWKKKQGKRGLHVEVTEPNYELVAYQGDLTLQYKIEAKDGYKELEEVLLNRDKTFLSTIFAVTAPTETDNVAKAATFLAHHRNTAGELIQFFATQEIMASATENTLFRLNSVSSKMFKFYSKLVGTKYLFFTLALVINELNTVAQKAAEEAEKMDEEDDKKASLLNFEMEVDPSKIKDANIDIDQNVFQLAAACQKIFSVIKTGSDKVPMEFRQIFQRMSYSIMDKYGSEDAVMKAVGGLLFLRFITPALTAPSYFGLLPTAPNTVAQRQLVLIGKVLQNLANMTSLGAKEQFMNNFEDFMQRNVPKMRQLYESLLDPATPYNQRMKLELRVPENVRMNSLALIYTHIFRNESKIRTALQNLPDEERAQALTGTLNDLLAKYGEPPKKAKEKAAKDDN